MDDNNENGDDFGQDSNDGDNGNKQQKNRKKIVFEVHDEGHSEDDTFDSNVVMPRKLARSISQGDQNHIEAINPANYHQHNGKQRSFSVTSQPVTNRSRPQSTQDYPRSRHMSATVQPYLQRIESNGSLANHKGKQNNNMILQVVLPQNFSTATLDSGQGSLLSPHTTDSLGNGVRIRKHGSSVSQPDFQNGDVHPYAFDFNHVGSNRKSETVISEAHSLMHSTPRPEKKRVFRERITITLSIIYAVYVLTLGTTLYVSNIVVERPTFVKVFSYYIILVALSFIIYIMADVSRFMAKRRRYYKQMEKNRADDMTFEEVPEVGIKLSIPVPDSTKMQRPQAHHYCLDGGKHAGSMYLKLGATMFCIGHLVHSFITIGYQLVYLPADSEMFQNCIDIALLVLDFIYPMYSFLLLFFVFKYSNVLISRNIPLVRFGFMHCIATAGCLWIYTILRETFDSLALYDIQNQEPEYDLSPTSRLFTPICMEDEGMQRIFMWFSPYLYPFSVEFNILIGGILYMVWSNIGKCKQNFDHDAPEIDSPRDCDSNIDAPDKESNVNLHIDCHASNKGLFAGLIVFIVVIVRIILHFVSLGDDELRYTGSLITNVTNIVIQAVMIFACIWSYWKIAILDVNYQPISVLDDVLLFMCIPFFFLNMLFTVTAAYYMAEGIMFSLTLIEVLQITIQTPFIVDALRRCSNSKDLRKKKYGREMVTFLVIANVALWFSQTFEVKSVFDPIDIRYDYYGKALWTILGHVSLPLMMFYRFHASVCLADVWKFAYEKAGH